VLVQCANVDLRCVGGELAKAIDSLVVVNMEQATDGSHELYLSVTRGQRLQASSTTKFGPASIVRVDIVQFEATLLEELRQTHVADGTQFRDALLPTRRNGVPYARQDDVASDRIELKVASCWKERKVPVDLTLQIMATSAKECPVAEVVAEFTPMQSDKVEDGALRFALRSTQTSAELLEETVSRFRSGGS